MRFRTSGAMNVDTVQPDSIGKVQDFPIEIISLLSPIGICKFLHLLSQIIQFRRFVQTKEITKPAGTITTKQTNMILEYQTEDILLEVPRKNIMIPRKITPKIQQFKQDIFLESLSIFLLFHKQSP